MVVGIYEEQLLRDEEEARDTREQDLLQQAVDEFNNMDGVSSDDGSSMLSSHSYTTTHGLK